MKMLIISLSILLLVTGCKGSGAAIEAPALLEPEGVTYDTAIAVKGTISRIRQYRSGIKAYSKSVFFGETSLRFKQFHVRAGQIVKKGEILAELETKDLLKEIERQEEAIEHLRRTFEFENQMLQYDMEIANLELESLSLSGANSSELELKKVSVQKLGLALTHRLEAQELELRQCAERLEEIKVELDSTYITAPFDGTVVYTENLYEGSAITPYKPVVYVTDKSRIMIEYSGSDYYSYSSDMELYAQIGDRMYDLEFAPLTLDEKMSYVLEGRTPPSIFVFADEDIDVEPGGFAAVYSETDKRTDVIMVPINALYSSAGENYVYIMNNGVKEMHPVETGVRNDSFVEIKSGLDEGAEVFVKQ